jgi:hypothetical protein
MRLSTGLVVITLLLLGCGTMFGESVELGFLSSDMSFQYCDVESFITYPGGLATGIDSQAGCGEIDGILIGAKVTFPPSFLPLAGTFYALADSNIDAGCDCFTGDQGLLITGTKAYNIHAPHFGWEYLYNTYDSFYTYLNDWGYLIAADVSSKASKQSLTHTLTRSHPINQ